MVAHYPVPIQEDIRELLGDLLGRGVAIDKTRELVVSDDEPGLIATYLNDDDELGILVVTDAPFAILVGAALVMVPAQVAKEQLGAGVIEDDSVEYVREVANILARILNTPRTPHVRLVDMIQTPTELDEAVEKLLATPEFRRDFVATIEGYGEGRISILVN